MSYISVKIHADEIHDLIETKTVDYVIESDIDDKIEEAINDADIVSEKDVDEKVYDSVQNAIGDADLKSEKDIEKMIQDALEGCIIDRFDNMIYAKVVERVAKIQKGNTDD